MTVKGAPLFIRDGCGAENSGRGGAGRGLMVCPATGRAVMFVTSFGVRDLDANRDITPLA
jgi:hypothetical protein